MRRVRFGCPLLAVTLAMSVLVASSAHAALVGDPTSDAANVDSSLSSLSATDAFHWLNPIAPSSGDTAKLDASLLNYLTVEVCEVTNAGCATVQMFASAGVSSEQLRIEKTGKVGGYYIVTWDTQKAKQSLTKNYRIIVSMPGLELGSIELAPPTYKTFGRTWPIKFLVENNPAIRVRLLRHSREVGLSDRQCPAPRVWRHRRGSSRLTSWRRRTVHRC